jgi:hypothetical protein
MFELRPEEVFSLEEAKQQGAEYSFINESILYEKYTNQFLADFFIPPDDLYKNNFIPLVLYEYKTRAKLLYSLSKHDMCDQPTTLFYQMPENLSQQQTAIFTDSFDTLKSLTLWKLQNYNQVKQKTKFAFSKTQGKTNLGSLSYSWESVQYTLPRIWLDKFPVKEDDIVTLSAWIKSANLLTSTQRDGFFRVDFYYCNTILKIFYPINYFSY